MAQRKQFRGIWSESYSASVLWNPADLVGASAGVATIESSSVGVVDASVGDMLIVTADADLAGLVLTAQALSGSVSFTLMNHTASAINVASTLFHVVGLKRVS